MIKSVTLSQLALQTQGELLGEDACFESVSIDTRTLKKGDLFIAIKGEQFDGHHYLSQAMKLGCCAAVISNQESANSLIADVKQNKVATSALLLVENTEKALGELARINRCAFSGPVFGLTGSTGKTSTKNMLAAILNEKGKACATEGNFNNEIGVPLTLLSINATHDYAVVEMGARAKGDIRYLSEYVQADVAIVLNAGLSHIDIFGSRENIVKTKGEIYQALAKDDVAIVNMDDPAIETWKSYINDKTSLGFSLTKSQADVYASDIQCDTESCHYVLHYLESSQQIKLPVPGKHNISNSLAAATAALAVGFDLKTIARGLSKLQRVAGRLNTIKLSNGLTLIDDTYNANPASMKASLDVLSLRAGYKIAVLGEMAELGERSLALHLELAKYAVKTEIDQFYFIGEHAEKMKACFEGQARACFSKKEILDCIRESVIGEETILVKGSRSAGMDELIVMLEGWAA